MIESGDIFDLSYNYPLKEFHNQGAGYRSACAQVQVVVEGSQNH